MIGGGILTIAFHTFRQCARMKVVIAFMSLLAITLAALPSILKGDGTLTGKVKTFFDYAFTASAVLILTMTVFMTVAVVSEDVRKKQVFMVMTKPLARWQYIIGRWLGVVLLNLIFLAAVGASVYSISQYLRQGRALDMADRHKLESEVFVARASVFPKPSNISEKVEEKIGQLKNSGRYAEMLRSYQQNEQMSESQAAAMINAVLEKEATEATQVVSPEEFIEWNFEGINLSDAVVSEQGQVVAMSQEKATIQIKASSEFIGQLLVGTLITVNGQQGRVSWISADAFNVEYEADDLPRLSQSGIALGQNVEMIHEPVVQITYKPQAVSSKNPDAKLIGLMIVTNTSNGAEIPIPVENLSGVMATVGVPARLVDSRGTLRVRYANGNFAGNPKATVQTSVRIPSGNILVLYRVGSFGANLFRGMLLMCCGMMFITSVGIFCGSFLSFGVGCLLAFLAFPFALLRDFLLEAVVQIGYSKFEAAIAKIAYYILNVMSVLIPNLTNALPGDRLIDGTNMPWSLVGSTALIAVGVQSAILLFFACLIFGRRELARVQV